MTADVLSLLKTGAALADDALERLLPAPTIEPHSIHRAMRHSTFAGGKRLRPILAMEAARMTSGTGDIPEGAANLGAAIEMITSEQPPLPKGAAELGAAIELLHT